MSFIEESEGDFRIGALILEACLDRWGFRAAVVCIIAACAFNAHGSPPQADKVECEAQVAKAYPANLWAPGLSKKRKALFEACIAKRFDSDTETDPEARLAIDQAECDAEVATTYPANLYAPGLSRKRKELFAACMAQRGAPESEEVDHAAINNAECDAEVARTYPANLWAPGLRKKRKQLFEVCMSRRQSAESK
jgi:hypothetical protein